MEKDLNSITMPSPGKRIRRWQLLIVEDNGRIIAINRIWLWAVGLMVSLVAAVICAVLFGYLYGGSLQEIEQLRKAVQDSRKRGEEIRDERDILMAKLAVAESRNAIRTISGEKKTAAADKPAVSPGSGKKEARPDISKADMLKEVPLHEEKSPEKKPEETAAGEAVEMKVDAEDFVLTYDAEKEIMRIRFIIRNSDRSVQTVEGYIFVILKPDEGGKQNWVSIPSVELQNGRPLETGRGQYFKISNYKTVHFRVTNQPLPENYSNAAVQVYDPAGRLLLEKSFPVEIKLLKR